MDQILCEGEWPYLSAYSDYGIEWQSQECVLDIEPFMFYFCPPGEGEVFLDKAPELPGLMGWIHKQANIRLLEANANREEIRELLI